MTNFTQVAVPAHLTPQRTATPTTWRIPFDAAALYAAAGSVVGNGDTIELGYLKPGMTPIDAFLRIGNAAPGAASSTMQLQYVYGGTTTNLTTTLSSATSNGTTGLLSTYAPPNIIDTTTTGSVRIQVTGAALVSVGTAMVELVYDGMFLA
jgi:hypothetical protein